MPARIYQPARTAMQSGTAKTKAWVLEYMPSSAREIDPLMGWTSSGDMNSQVRLRFASREEAEAYATENRIAYEVQEPNARAHNVRAGGYGENFSSGRRSAWTH